MSAKMSGAASLASPLLKDHGHLVRVIATSMGGDVVADLQLLSTGTGYALKAALAKQIGADTAPWRLKLVLWEDLVSDGVSLKELLGKGDDGDLEAVRVQVVKLPRPTIELYSNWQLENKPASADKELECVFRFRILVMGSANSGKSALVRRAVDDKFSEKYIPTIGVYLSNQSLIVNGTTRVKLQVWDCAGQSRYRGLINNYTRGHHWAIVVFSMLNRDSFLEAATFVKTIRGGVANEHSGPPPLSVVGTYCDRAAERVISEEEGRHFAESLGAGVTYMEATATDVESATEVLHHRIEDLLERSKLLVGRD